MFDDEEGMDEIRQIFLEESTEGLDVMESGLLQLEPGTADMEVINNIFRAAHSIKGGGGTFGFLEVSDFTHWVSPMRWQGEVVKGAISYRDEPGNLIGETELVKVYEEHRRHYSLDDAPVLDEAAIA